MAFFMVFSGVITIKNLDIYGAHKFHELYIELQSFQILQVWQKRESRVG
jgi:hypothetical protein